eukprot:s2515_g14.t1
MDPLVCEFLEHLWATGEGRALASDTVAGLQDADIKLRGHLQGSWRLLKTWSINEVPNRAPPLPFHVLQAMVGWAFFRQHFTFGVSLLVGYFGMLRTGEILGIKACHVLFETQHPRAVISLDMTKGGKRQGAAESVVVGYDMVVTFLKHWKQLSIPSTPLAKNPGQWRKLFNEALTALHLQQFNFRPYSLRRGGATWREKGRSRREEREESDSDDRDEAKKVMYVSGTFVGMIIGRGGESIKAMSRESGARIEVSRDDLGDRDADRTVTILGTQEAVDKASRMIEDIVARSEEEPHFGPAPRPRTVEAPPGFDECEHEEWLYNPSTKEYFSKKSGALAWLNESTGIFCPIREGVKHSDLQPVTAGTAVLTSVAPEKAGSVTAAVPKTVVIPDLHRVAMALKLPFDHVDSPCAMLAVFGGSEPAAAAMNFHEKLLRRIASWRSVWMDQAWLAAMTAAMMDLAGSGPLPVMAAALQMGPRLVSVASPGAHLALTGAPPPLVTESGSGAFALLQRGETDAATGRWGVRGEGTKWWKVW